VPKLLNGYCEIGQFSCGSVARRRSKKPAPPPM